MELETKPEKNYQGFWKSESATTSRSLHSSPSSIMATPFSSLETAGGGVAVMAGPLNPIDPSTSSKSCLKNSDCKSPILIFLFFHKAIRAELDALHKAAVAFATNRDCGGDVSSLLQRYHFLRTIYKHHCNAEDEVGVLVLFMIAFSF